MVKKKFMVSFWEEVQYLKQFEAENEEELKKKFENGELEFSEGIDIIDGNYIEDSLEISELEK